MDHQTLTEFFMWCTISNGGLLVFWFAFTLFLPDLDYRLQSTFFPMPRVLFIHPSRKAAKPPSSQLVIQAVR